MASDTQNTAPERIWADWIAWYAKPNGRSHAYIRADIHERLVAEAVAAALKEAAEVAANEADYVPVKPDDFRKAIRELIKDPSILAKRDARIKAAGMREAVEVLEEQPLGISGPMNPVSDVLQLVSSILLSRADEIEKGEG